MWIWIVIVALLVIVLTVLLSSVNIRVEVLKQANDDYACLQVHMLYGLIRFQYELPSIVIDRWRQKILVKIDKYVNIGKDKENKEDTSIDKRRIEEIMSNVRLLLKNTVSLKQWVNETIAHVTFSQLHWATRLGVRDCAHTAILSGWVWAFKGFVVGWTSGHVRYGCLPDLAVIPSWEQRNTFSTHIVCSASISMAYVMFSLCKLLIRILKVPGGFKAWKQVFAKPASADVPEHR